MSLSQLIIDNKSKIIQIRVTTKCNIPNVSVKGGPVKSLIEQIGKPFEGKIDLDNGTKKIVKGEETIIYKPIK